MNKTPETDKLRSQFTCGAIHTDFLFRSLATLERQRNKARLALLAMRGRESLACGWCREISHAPPGFTPPMPVDKIKHATRLHMLDCPKHPARETEKELQELREEVRLTLMENLHLADGDVCTLKRLKDAIHFQLPA